MNLLAHIYLSGENDDIKIGNFIGDWIKGRDHENYPEDIQKGILLHRDIDSFTDTHPIVLESKSRLYYKYHKYAGVLVDMFYDHFLSRYWLTFSVVPLKRMTTDFWEMMMDRWDELPPGVQQFLPGFIEKNWISYYDSIDGMEEVLRAMMRRGQLLINITNATRILEEHYTLFNQEFHAFFPVLIDYVEDKYAIDIIRP